MVSVRDTDVFHRVQRLTRARFAGHRFASVVDYVPDLEGQTNVRVVCDDCGRSVSSPTLTDEEICALVGWLFDFGAVVCLLCQGARGVAKPLAGRAVP
jgi:hypothetical protein